MNNKMVIEINCESLEFETGITVKQALEICGYKTTKYPEKGSLFVLCEVGGCWNCPVKVNEELKPACITLVKDGLRINTHPPKDYLPKRIIHGFGGHTVGGAGASGWHKKNHD